MGRKWAANNDRFYELQPYDKKRLLRCKIMYRTTPSKFTISVYKMLIRMSTWNRYSSKGNTKNKQ